MLVKIEGVSKTFRCKGGAEIPVLRPISLEIERGEFAVVMGPSGSGKSTLLQLIGGLDNPCTGRVIVDGEDLTSLAEPERARFRRRRLGFVFQSFHLLPLLSVEENVALPLVLDGVARSVAVGRARELLARVAGLSHRSGHRPHQLSGGEKQRAAIARALIAGPALILADEPTGALDSAAGTLVLSTLQSVCREAGATIVMVTHDRAAAAHGSRLIEVLDGRVVGDRRITGDGAALAVS